MPSPLSWVDRRSSTSSWLLMVRDSPRVPRLVLVNAEMAEAAPVAGWAADSVRDSGTPVCGPAVPGVGAGAGTDGAGAGAAVVPPVVVFVVAVAPGVYVPASKAFLCGHSLALCPSCLQMKQLNVPFLLKRGWSPWRLCPGRPAPPAVANAIATGSPAYGTGARAVGWCRVAHGNFARAFYSKRISYFSQNYREINSFI